MKMTNLLIGLALLTFAFSAAAFTAKQTSDDPHYIQKPGVCEEILNTGCADVLGDPCQEQGFDVYAEKPNEAECQTLLKRP